MLKEDTKTTWLNADNLIWACIVLTFFLLPTGTAPPLVSFGLAVFVWLFSGKCLHAKSIFVKPWFYPVIPIVVFPWIGLLYSQNLDLGLDYALKTKYWIAVFLTAGVCINPERFPHLLKGFWAGLMCGAILAFFQLLGVIEPIRNAFLGFGVAHTLISMYLIIGMLTASRYFKQAKSFYGKVLLLFFLVAFLFHLAVLENRTSYLIFGLVSPLIAGNILFGFSKKIKIAACMLLLAALLSSPTVRTEIVGTIHSIQEKKDSILKGENVREFPRVFIYKSAVEIIAAHPLTGVGTGSIAEITEKKGHLVSHPHNNFLYMGASFGILGILACIWLYTKMFMVSFRKKDSVQGYFVFSTCIVLFLAGMLDTSLLNTGTLLFMALSYGMLNHLEEGKQDRGVDN